MKETLSTMFGSSEKSHEDESETLRVEIVWTEEVSFVELW